MKANAMKSVRLRKLIRGVRLDRAIALALLLVLLGVGAIPGYWTGNWPWAELPKITNLNQIRNLRQTGLELPGLQTIEQKTVKIGGRDWSYQEIKGDYRKPILLLLMPPSDHTSQPQVEWVDIDSVFQWKTDSYTTMQFEVKPSELASLTAATDKNSIAQVEARFFRAWTQQQTFAVVQWYASPNGGHPAPSRWFWTDQLAQLHRQRVPWVAVCLQIPMEPLGDLEASESLAESLSKIVQAALMVDPFTGTSSAS